MMDREFDSDPVKDTCEKYGIHYLNPTRIFATSDEADTIAWMYRNGERFHVTEEEADDETPTRKQAYLPKQSNSDAEEGGEDDLSAAWTELCGEWEFEDVDGEPSEGMSFSRLLADIQREEEVEERKQKAQFVVEFGRRPRIGTIHQLPAQTSGSTSSRPASSSSDTRF